MEKDVELKNELIVALSYTKQRTVFAMVGIEIDARKRMAYVRLAKQWKREKMNDIPEDVREIYDKVKWHYTFADQLIGQHLIRGLENSLKFQVQTITTQKNLKDPEDIEAIKVMDMTEMTQLTLSLKQDHSIQFPPKNQTKDMQQLVKEIEMFTEHVTEQGTVSYFAPGQEHDGLPKALMICCFVGRQSLQLGGQQPMVIHRGVTQPKNINDSADEIFEQLLGENYDSLSASTLNSSRTRNRILYGSKTF